MGCIILQHWDSNELPDWAVTASKTMRAYAAKCGSDYRLLNGAPLFDMLHGVPLDPSLFHPNVQKLAFLAEEFDEYDQVCMYDMDMCATPWAKNVFDDPGNINLWDVGDPSAMDFCYSHPWMMTGAVYKFDRQQRRALREILLKLDLSDSSPFHGMVRSDEEAWCDEHLFQAMLHHPTSTLDPASIKQIHIGFEAVVHQSAGWGREKRPTRDREVSVRHFSKYRKHLIIPVVGKWYGTNKLKSRLANAVYRWRYFKQWLPHYLNMKTVLIAKNRLRRFSVGSSNLPLEMTAEICDVDAFF